MNYYNDIDPTKCAWLRQLIADGLIPPGEVDERSIADVQPMDLLGFDQWHFFAGIGGWAMQSYRSSRQNSSKRRKKAAISDIL